MTTSVKKLRAVPTSPVTTVERLHARECEPRIKTSIPSIIKWTGSKRSQAWDIWQLMPSYDRYIEPFVGGGALLYLSAVPGSVAGDIYRPLIKLWQLIQRDPERVIESYRIHSKCLNEELDRLDIHNLPANKNLPAYYYTVRNRFNANNDPLDLNFILRTCVNGIVRFNNKGEFNNSFHLSRRGMEAARFDKIVYQWHQIVRNVKFVCQDYALTLQEARQGDLVYLDPPYAGSSQRYIDNLDTTRLFHELAKLSKRGVKWMLSFDGSRGNQSLLHEVPRSLFKRHLLLSSGISAVNKVLNGPVESVEESLYLNY